LGGTDDSFFQDDPETKCQWKGSVSYRHKNARMLKSRVETNETNPSDNNKSQAIEIRRGTNSLLKPIKNKLLRVFHQNIRGLKKNK
jgi:hypothetical protein